MRLPALLLIDDDSEFIRAQTVALGADYHIITAEGVNTALQILQKNEIDCVIVDYYLSDGNGHDIARWVASNRPWCPVVLISARLDKKIAVESFSHKIFDILEKPYEHEALLEKISAALEDFKRKKKDFSEKESLSQSRNVWSLNSERRVFYWGGDAILLTSTEVRILEILILGANQVVSRDKLVQAIWGTMHVADNTLDTHLTNLRKKAPFFKTIIKGIRGVGYVFEP